MRPRPSTPHDEDTTMRSILGEHFKENHRYAMVRTRRARQLEQEGWRAIESYGEGCVIMSKPKETSE